MNDHPRDQIAGVVLAGGQGRRMGPEPKVLMRLHGVPLFELALRRAAPQVGLLCMSSHLSVTQLGNPGVAVIPDPLPGFLGPLAGVCSALQYACANAPSVKWLCTFAADTPWFPADLAYRLWRTLKDADDAQVAVARSGERRHPVFALWPVSALPVLLGILETGADRSLARCQAALGVVWADWPSLPRDPFFNLNTPADFACAQAEPPEPADKSGGIG